MGPTIVAGIVAGGIYGLIAVGIVLAYKGSRVLNFAQGELGTWGLFCAWWLITKHHVPWGIAAVGGIASSVVIAMLFERLVVRRMVEAPRLSVAVATVGLFLFLLAAEAFVFKTTIAILGPPISGLGPKIFDFYVGPTALMSLAAVTLIAAGLAVFLRRTDFGLGVLAASQDPTMVRLVGVRLSRVSAFTWAIAGAVGAVAALLVEPTVGAFAPGFMTQFFIRGLAAALVGGMTSLPGAFVGGLSVGLVEAVAGKALLSSQIPGIRTFVVFVVIIVVLLVRPAGILSNRRVAEPA